MENDLKRDPSLQHWLTGPSCFYVATGSENGTDFVLGTMAYAIEGGETLRLHRVYVDSLGRRSGLGSRLFSQVLEDARKKELKRIVLGTSEPQEAAVQFYEKHGFQLRERRRMNYALVNAIHGMHDLEYELVI